MLPQLVQRRLCLFDQHLHLALALLHAVDNVRRCLGQKCFIGQLRASHAPARQSAWRALSSGARARRQRRSCARRPRAHRSAPCCAHRPPSPATASTKVSPSTFASRSTAPWLRSIQRANRRFGEDLDRQLLLSIHLQLGADVAHADDQVLQDRHLGFGVGIDLRLVSQRDSAPAQSTSPADCRRTPRATAPR